MGNLWSRREAWHTAIDYSTDTAVDDAAPSHDVATDEAAICEMLRHTTLETNETTESENWSTTVDNDTDAALSNVQPPYKNDNTGAIHAVQNMLRDTADDNMTAATQNETNPTRRRKLGPMTRQQGELLKKLHDGWGVVRTSRGNRNIPSLEQQRAQGLPFDTQRYHPHFDDDAGTTSDNSK